MVLFFVQPLERFEQPAHIFLTDTDAGIDHLHMKDHIFRSIFHILFLDDQSHFSFSCIFHCIRQQVNDEINAQIDALYADGKANLLAFGIIIIGITVALYLDSYLIMRYGYHITEEDEKKMMEELAKRNEANIAKEEQAMVA